MLDEKVAAIRDKLERLMPGIDTEPDYAWCGSFGASPTGTPSIGAVPGCATAPASSATAATASPSR